MRPVITAVGLTKVFRDFWQRARVRAVSDLDLTVEPGQIYGLLGPNGSGKSTTIKMLLGLLHPTRGHIAIFDRPPDDVRIKTRVGYLPEESYLYRFLNARETLHYYGTLFQLPRRERTRRIEELLDMVGLRSQARRPVGEYSKGMARRIGLAQALINDPDLLILDEPTSGLDPTGSKLVKDVILRLGQEFKKTILLSSHLLADVEEVCSRVTILYGGRVRMTGTMEEVLARHDRIRLESARLRPETIDAVRQLVEQREGQALEVSTPRDRLEALFLRIIEEAHERQVETHGSAKAGAIAGFLGAEQSGAAVLESLVKVEPQRDEAAPPHAAGEPDEPAEPSAPGVLDELTGRAAPAGSDGRFEQDGGEDRGAGDDAGQPGDAERDADAAGPSGQIDRSLLDELTKRNDT